MQDTQPCLHACIANLKLILNVQKSDNVVTEKNISHLLLPNLKPCLQVELIIYWHPYKGPSCVLSRGHTSRH